MASSTNETVDESKKITLYVADSSNYRVQFQISRHKPLRKLMDVYCQRQRLESEELRFLYDGKRFYGEATAASLGMRDGDLIDCQQKRNGGGSSINNHNSLNTQICPQTMSSDKPTL